VNVLDVEQISGEKDLMKRKHAFRSELAATSFTKDFNSETMSLMSGGKRGREWQMKRMLHDLDVHHELS
jgi:hypothetical protein